MRYFEPGFVEVRKVVILEEGLKLLPHTSHLGPRSRSVRKVVILEEGLKLISPSHAAGQRQGVRKVVILEEGLKRRYSGCGTDCVNSGPKGCNP